MTREEEIICIDILNGEGCKIVSGAELRQLIDLFRSLKDAQEKYSNIEAHQRVSAYLHNSVFRRQSGE